jgi:hypothetical protein
MLGSGEAAWKATVRASGITGLTRPHLRFVVASLTRGGRPFDLDNLCSPVLGIVAPGPVESVWATVEVGEPEGVWVSEEAPPSPPADAEVRLVIARPPVGSKRRDEPLPELRDAAPLGVGEPLGLHLAFHDPAARVGDFGFTGPVKPLIDALAPLFGGTLHAPHDHRVRDLRVVRGRPGQVVEAVCWRLGPA